ELMVKLDHLSGYPARSRVEIGHHAVSPDVRDEDATRVPPDWTDRASQMDRHPPAARHLRPLGVLKAPVCLPGINYAREREELAVVQQPLPSEPVMEPVERS